MRTKTLALSALLGVLGAASVMAQTNVYSINAVGYINVTLFPGYNIITCPLVCSPDNTIGTVLNNSNNTLTGTTHATKSAFVYQYANGSGYVGQDQTTTAGPSNPNGWTFGGTIAVNPGVAVYFFNPTTTNMLATFVGQVAQANNNTNANGMTNQLVTGFNLVGSEIPISGDLISNSITSLSNGSAFTPHRADTIDVYDPTANGSGQWGFTTGGAGGSFTWSSGNQWDEGGLTPDPMLATVYEGFWYQNTAAANTTNSTWVENFTINP